MRKLIFCLTSILAVSACSPTEPEKAQLSVNPASFTFTKNTNSGILLISNRGSGEVSWEISDKPEWLEVSKVSGKVTTGNDTVIVTAYIEQEAVKYSGSINITSNYGNKEVTIIAKNPQKISGSFRFQENDRSYIVYLPESYISSNNFPLVIYLHAYGWNAQKGMDYTLLHQATDTSGFIVVFPNGYPQWNSGISDDPGWPTPDVDDVGFVNALIDTLSNHYSINLEKIYACVYSNGGFMAYKLACLLSNRIAAIASVGGVMSASVAANCNPLTPVPILQIHGTKDPWVPIDGSPYLYSVDQTLSYWINFNNCVQADTTTLPDLNTADECTVEKITYTNGTNNSCIVYYKVINGGHTWPGAGDPGYPAGNTNKDINANIEILKFFKKH